MTETDKIYCELIKSIINTGECVSSRNGTTIRAISLPTVVFSSTPLVTVRKTAWIKAIREMEWFLSGESLCPAELRDWWGGQLNEENRYLAGYGEQLRRFTGLNGEFDQIAALIDGLRNHPFSRRHVITTWCPPDMNAITKINKNPKTPTTCHTTIAQFFVSSAHELSMHSYQRSADMLLGVPHNWIQSWALLLWLANQTDNAVGSLIWTFGDAHIYCEDSHLLAVEQILSDSLVNDKPPRLEYINNNSSFKLDDFIMAGSIPAPKTNIRPRML